MYRWLVVLMLWCVCLFNYADRQAVYSVFDPIGKEMGLGKGELGIVGSSFMWVYAAAAPFAGLAGDRFRRKTLILGGLVFWSVVCAATALSTRYWHLVLFRALEGLGEAFYFPASMSLIADYHGRRTRSRAMGIHQSSVYIGTVAGGTLAGFLADRGGWRSSFWILGALGIALAAVLGGLLREAPRGSVEEVPEPAAVPPGKAGGLLAAFGDLLRRPMVLLLMAVFACANSVATVFLVWMPSYLKEGFGMSLTLAGFSATAYLQAASVAGVIRGGFLADRLAARRPGGRMMVQALGLFLGVPFIAIAGCTLSVPVLVAAVACFGLVKGLYDANIWAALHDFVPPERRAASVGLMNLVGWAAGAGAQVAVGFAADRVGLGPPIAACAAVYLAGGSLLLLGIARLRRAAAAPTATPAS